LLRAESPTSRGVTETGIVHLLRLRAQLRQIGDVKADTKEMWGATFGSQLTTFRRHSPRATGCRVGICPRRINKLCGRMRHGWPPKRAHSLPRRR